MTKNSNDQNSDGVFVDLKIDYWNLFVIWDLDIGI